MKPKPKIKLSKKIKLPSTAKTELEQLFSAIDDLKLPTLDELLPYLNKDKYPYISMFTAYIYYAQFCSWRKEKSKLGLAVPIKDLAKKVTAKDIAKEFKSNPRCKDAPMSIQISLRPFMNHANRVTIFPKSKEIHFFEPHGNVKQEVKTFYQQFLENLSKEMKIDFKGEYDVGYWETKCPAIPKRYKEFIDTSDKAKVSWQRTENIKKALKEMPSEEYSGWCQLWAILYANLAMLFPKYKVKEITAAGDELLGRVGLEKMFAFQVYDTLNILSKASGRPITDFKSEAALEKARRDMYILIPKNVVMPNLLERVNDMYLEQKKLKGSGNCWLLGGLYPKPNLAQMGQMLYGYRGPNVVGGLYPKPSNAQMGQMLYGYRGQRVVGGLYPSPQFAQMGQMLYGYRGDTVVGGDNVPTATKLGRKVNPAWAKLTDSIDRIIRGKRSGAPSSSTLKRQKESHQSMLAEHQAIFKANRDKANVWLNGAYVDNPYWYGYSGIKSRNPGIETFYINQAPTGGAAEWIQKMNMNQGAFTREAQSHGMSVPEFASHVINNKNRFHEKTFKRAVLARNFANMRRGGIKIHGNYCGPNWTAGMPKAASEVSMDEFNRVTPIDDLDAACKEHDWRCGHLSGEQFGDCSVEDDERLIRIANVIGTSNKYPLKLRLKAKAVAAAMRVAQKTLHRGNVGGYISRKRTKIQAARMGEDGMLLRQLPGYIQTFINKYGDIPIAYIEVCREPLDKNISAAANLITAGDFDKEKLNRGYDELFHLFSVIGLENGRRFVYEKNQKITLFETGKDFSAGSVKGAECVPVNNVAGKNVTFKEMVLKAMKQYGARNYVDYEMLSNNCQRFLSENLKAVGLLSSTLNSFINQDVTDIIPSLVRKGMHAATRLAAALTNLGHRFTKRPDILDAKKDKLEGQQVEHPILEKRKQQLLASQPEEEEYQSDIEELPLPSAPLEGEGELNLKIRHILGQMRDKIDQNRKHRKETNELCRECIAEYGKTGGKIIFSKLMKRNGYKPAVIKEYLNGR